MCCLLKRYVAMSDSGVVNRNAERGKNASNEPLRRHIEQLHSSASVTSPSSSNAILPQWQLPAWVMAGTPGWGGHDSAVAAKTHGDSTTVPVQPTSAKAY